ncbi:MAG: stage II sporulation protein R [Halanaerobiaceae bacterium]
MIRKAKIIFLLLLFTVILSLYASSAVVIRKDTEEIINAYKNNNLIRLHVVARSNSPRDQYIKRKVRQKVLSLVAGKDSTSFTTDEDSDQKNSDVEWIEKEINNFLHSEEVDYESRVNFGKYDFPGRTYNDITLPSDEYRALKIELGRAEGANWWCVLLPPLCTEENIEKREEKAKKEVKGKEEKGEEEKVAVPDDSIELRFKLKEVISEAMDTREDILTFDFWSGYFQES